MHGELGMTEQRLEKSRRKLIRTIVGGVSAGMLFRMPPASASDKMTRQQAQYRDRPNGIYSCGMCTLFEAPNACKVVEGEISKDGWCKAFAPVD
jgi:hypothetical protein